MPKNVLAGSKLVMLLILTGLFLFTVRARLAQAKPAEQTAGDNVVKALTVAFNAKDLNACLALMTDDAMVKVVNPSDLANARLTNDTLTYTGKQGPQSQVANFFNINFTNGFTIWSTNFKTTDTSFSGSMQLAIRDFVIEADVQGTLEGGKIKTLVITDKTISKKASQPANMPTGSPATGLEDKSSTLVGSQSYLGWGWGYVFAVSGVLSLLGLVVVRKRRV